MTSSRGEPRINRLFMARDCIYQHVHLRGFRRTNTRAQWPRQVFLCLAALSLCPGVLCLIAVNYYWICGGRATIEVTAKSLAPMALPDWKRTMTKSMASQSIGLGSPDSKSANGKST